MTQEDFINLKMAVSNINNILTVKLTLSAIEWLAHFFSLSEDEKNNLIEIVEKTNSNTNGFDIISEGKCNFLAEVKCNVPSSNGEKYLAAQRNSILDDALKLINGKKGLKDTRKFYKFIFLLDLGAKTNSAIFSLLKPRISRSEDQKRINRNEITKKMVLLNEHKLESLDPVMVYVILLKIN
jgi:hypothetical protein